MSGRPLIVSDCDEVLMHMVVPFKAWLDEQHDIHFDFTIAFEDALRHKETGDVVGRERIWPLLSAFFETEMHRQTPIAGAVEAMQRLSRRADIVILTNIGPELAPARTRQLAGCGAVSHRARIFFCSANGSSVGRPRSDTSPASRVH